VGKPPLVGRAEPLRRLRRALDEALAGIGRLALISGEPGVGKTRLALEVLEIAERRGTISAVGACWEGAGAPGLWPWVQLLRALRAALGDDSWNRAARSGHDALTRLLDTDQPNTSGEFHLFEATLQLFAHVCEELPLVVLLDDLQWADPASLTLVDFLHHHGFHLPLLIVGTYRDNEVSGPDQRQQLALADLSEKALTVRLDGLDNDGIRELRGTLGVPTSAAEAEHLRRLTAGNPFFVIESAAFSDPMQSLGVRRAVDRRIDALGQLERRVLTVASVIGREAPDGLVHAVVGDGSENALRAIESSGLMRREDYGQHQFVHDLVRESMRERISPDEHRTLCAAIVRAADAPAFVSCLLPAQLSWLATQAVPDIAAERAVALLEAAALYASAHLTHEAAGRHLEEAAALTEDPDEWARLTLQSGHAYHCAGALALARDRYASLLGHDRVETRARALLGLHQLGDPAAVAEPSVVVLGLDQVDAELQVGTPDTALRAKVLAARSRSRTHLLADDRSGAAPMAAEALKLARAAGDDSTVATCLLAYHDAVWEPGTESERRLVADEIATTGSRLADPALEAQGLLLRMVAEIEMGDDHYLATYAQFDAVAEAMHSPRLGFLAASRRGMVAALQADLTAAVEAIDAARALGERIGEPDAVGMWCDQRWQVARYAGDQETIKELVRTLRDTGDPHWMLYEALVSADLGDTQRARRVRPELIELGRRWPRWAARLWDIVNVQMAILEHDQERIADLADRLEADGGHWAVLGGGVLVHGPMSLWLGRLESARGNPERALSWSTTAEAAAQRLDAQLWLLEARTDRLALQHTIGRADPTEVASTMSWALDRGLMPIAERLRTLAPSTISTAANVFRRDHDVWTLVYDGVEVRLPDAKGLRDLRTLLANPRVDVPATSLVTDAFVCADAPPVLDATAKAAYRHRLDDLDRDLDRAAFRGDPERAESLEKERQALLDELRRAAGLGGRNRATNSDRERLRKTVTARIRDTLRRLDDRHPPLAAHLRATVRTGGMCTYAPSEPINWDLGA
jgi:hypothetical protein